MGAARKLRTNCLLQNISPKGEPMLFGKSVFQSILTRLDDEDAQEADAQPQANFRVSGLPMGFVTETWERPEPSPTESLYRLYGLDEEQTLFKVEEPPPPPPVMPPHLARLSDTEIAEDLALKPQDTPEKLMARRRAFAKLNHPDRVHPDFRPQATRRMTVANMLVDQALRLHPHR